MMSLVRPASSSRLPLVDVLRFVCVIWVMWIHIVEVPGSGETAAFARFRLPVFIILSIFFVLATQERRPGRGLGQYAVERFRQLYLPFLFWALVYYVLNSLIEVFIDGRVWPAPSRGIWFHGQAVHLWFVPFILAADVLTFPLARWALARPQMARAFVGGSMLLAMALLAFAGPGLTDRVIPYDYPAHVKDLLWRGMTLGPCIFFGIAVYFTYSLARAKWGEMSGSLALLGLGAFVVFGSLGAIWRPHPLIEGLAGFGIVLFALGKTSNRVVLRLAGLGRYSFSMYLMHMLFIVLFGLFREHVLHKSPSLGYDLVTLGCTAGLSLGFSILLSRNRLARFITIPSASSARPFDATPTLR